MRWRQVGSYQDLFLNISLNPLWRVASDLDQGATQIMFAFFRHLKIATSVLLTLRQVFFALIELLKFFKS